MSWCKRHGIHFDAASGVVSFSHCNHSFWNHGQIRHSTLPTLFISNLLLILPLTPMLTPICRYLNCTLLAVMVNGSILTIRSILVTSLLVPTTHLIRPPLKPLPLWTLTSIHTPLVSITSRRGKPKSWLLSSAATRMCFQIICLLAYLPPVLMICFKRKRVF